MWIDVCHILSHKKAEDEVKCDLDFFTCLSKCPSTKTASEFCTKDKDGFRILHKRQVDRTLAKTMLNH